MTDALQLLAFLYASMPLPDSVDYSREYWLQNIESSLTARHEMTWGADVPDREFRHFVLPVRVNNENLDDSRQVFYDELKERVQGLSMSEAILEVNHWCHEKVTYTPSDERTSSPLATVKTAYGRCGEESTFLVAALRSVCIPARQVYTPRWAHTDDNHAWVEAWADGEWHFLGACEPEPVLDLGWFNAPASRGMLMHTKVFGQYDGPEIVMQQNACYTEIDVTSHYAPVATAYAKVVDTMGNVVKDAKVEFKIYNYAEFYTVSTKKTDSQGIAPMQAGVGDLIAWAYKDGYYGFSKFHISEGDTIQVVLDHASGQSYSQDLEIVPPKERNTIPSVSDEQRKQNAIRLAYEDSLRNAYVATFPTEGLLQKARGNHATIQEITDRYANELGRSEFAHSLINTLSDKDLRDISAEVLDSHLTFSLIQAKNSEGLWSDSVFFHYIACPRVANEMLTPYRDLFVEAMGEERLRQMMEAGPASLVRWVTDSIAIDDVHNPQSLRMSPYGVWRHRVADVGSRNIFFVALARTLGFPSRIDPVTGKVQYLESCGQWHDVQFDTDKVAVSAPERGIGRLGLDYEPQRYLKDPRYYNHFTLSRLDQGRPVLLNYGEEDTWQSLFGVDGTGTQSLDAGDYLLTTGTRMASGSVLVHIEVTSVEPDKTLSLPIIMRQTQEGLQVIGNLNSESLYQPLSPDGASLCTMLSTTGRGFYVLGIIAPNNEPTNHALRDIAQYRKEFDEWGGTLLQLFRNEDEYRRFNISDFPQLPSHTVFGIDTTGQIARELMSGMHLSDASPLPFFVIADTFNRIVFLSEGYTIGLGETLYKSLVNL